MCGGCSMNTHTCMDMHIHTNMHVKHDGNGCLHVGSHLQFIYMYTCPCVHVHVWMCVCVYV